MPDKLEAVVVGSGFGGAVSAARLARRWPGKVLVLERGKRYPMGSFPRAPYDMAKNFWNLPHERRDRPDRMTDAEEHGLFDVRNYRHMDVVLGAGLGGGSLVYANVFMEPPDAVFDDRWPAGLNRAALAPYYRVAKDVLGARPVPVNGDPRRRLPRTELFQEAAQKLGRSSRLVDIMVFFGNDHADPLPIGQQDRNRYGALQTSCVYCGECDVGCNTHSKNTVDLNYLFVAENRYGARILTEHLVERLVPANERGEEDPAADGSQGYLVQYLDLRPESRGRHAVLTQRVVLGAGTLGSNELLLRGQSTHTLARLSDRLGQGFSGNGDFLSFVLGTEKPAHPSYGPVITQATDFNLFQDLDRSRAFLLEDAAYPAFAGWFVEPINRGTVGALARTLRDVAGRWLHGSTAGPMGYALSDLLGGDINAHAAVLLCMGLDRSNGVLSVGDGGNVQVDWPYQDSRPLYEAIEEAGEAFRRVTGADHFLPLPTWYWPSRKNVSVHALGGCRLADSPDRGVTSADAAAFGQVFGYRGLYVADGALVPTAVGANPSATIAALAERVAEGITGIAPDAAL